MWEEALLNAYSRSIALPEKTGNAVGRLQLLWTTVVVLGGFASNLGEDFWTATAIVLMEAFREFSRQSRFDDQILFKTTGGIKLPRVELGTNSRSLYFVNALIMPLYWFLHPVADLLYSFFKVPSSIYEPLPELFIPVILHKCGIFTFIAYLSRKESPILLQLSPLFALPPYVIVRQLSTSVGFPWHDKTVWADYVLIPQWIILYCSARFGSPGDHVPFHKGINVAARLIRYIFLFAIVVQLIFMNWNPVDLVLLFGPLFLHNFQTSMAIARIYISCQWLFWRKIKFQNTDNKNILVAVKLLYIMAFAQGILHIFACIVESFSSLPVRILAVGYGLTDKLGLESVKVYYEHTYDMFLQEGLFDTSKEKMTLLRFAVESLNSDVSRGKKRAAVRILDAYLQQNKTNSSSDRELIQLISSSPMAMNSLISMMGWTTWKDARVRMYAARVICQLAPTLRIIRIPGIMQEVSALLDAQDEPVGQGTSSAIVNGNNQQNPPLDLEHLEQGNMAGQAAKFCVESISRFLRYVEELWLIPWDDSTGHSLPELGMKIIESLAYDRNNCEEICRETEILEKVTGFIRCMTDTTKDARRENIGTPSLRLVARLASFKGKLGIQLRQQLSEYRFLIGSLVEIVVLDDSSTYLEQSQLAIDTIANLATDQNTSQKIGRTGIIEKLLQYFLGGNESMNPLRTAAGAALAVLAKDSRNAMLMTEPRFMLIEDLAKKIHSCEHIYSPASLLQTICANYTQSMWNRDQRHHFLTILPVVVQSIVDTEGEQTEVLIGLASQICSILREEITIFLNSFEDAEAFARKLVRGLNTHKKMAPDNFQNFKTLLVGLIVTMVELCPRYIHIFRENNIMEAMATVEQYMLLFGGDEPTESLQTIMARAKVLIGANAAPV